MADNTTTQVGNITREPDLRFTPSGQPVANFGLACNRRWKDAQDNWQEATSFFDVTCWGTLAENVAESLPKGSRVFVTGRLEQRTWETDDGSKRSKIEIVADEVGPSLRWATATVTKITREAGSPSNGAARRQEASVAANRETPQPLAEGEEPW